MVRVATNLNYICLDYNCILWLLDDQALCKILQQQITRLDISEWVGINSDLLQRIAEVFINLNHLVLVLQDSTSIIDSIPLTLLKFWNSTSLPSLSIKGSLSDEAKQNMRQWLINNSQLLAQSSFGVEYTDGWFDLWL